MKNERVRRMTTAILILLTVLLLAFSLAPIPDLTLAGEAAGAVSLEPVWLRMLPA